MYCTRLFSGILFLSFYAVPGLTQSETCTAPSTALIFPISDDHACFFSAITDPTAFPPSRCERNRVFGLRHSCWTESQVHSTISTNKSNQLPDEWSSWAKHSLHSESNKLRICHGILKIWSPRNQYCLYQWYVGPGITFMKKANTSNRIQDYYRDEQTMDVTILGSNNGGHHNVKANTSFNLTCYTTGKPKPSIEWQLPYNVSPIGDGIRVDGKVLHFDSIEPHHAGEYTCKGSQYTVKYNRKEQRAYRHESMLKYSSVVIGVETGDALSD